MDSVVYFYNKLRMDSKIPYNRFSARMDTGSNNSFKAAADGAERDEVRFGNFVARLRSIFQEILVKPLWIQMCLDFPELKDDLEFKGQIGIKFESDNTFGESREIQQLLKNIAFIEGLGEIKETINDEEVQYFNQDFLIETQLELNAEDIKSNEIYKEKAKKDKEKAEADEESNKDETKEDEESEEASEE